MNFGFVGSKISVGIPSVLSRRPDNNTLLTNIPAPLELVYDGAGIHYAYEAVNGSGNQCAFIDSTHFIVVYLDDDNTRVEARIGTIAGTVITFAAAVILSTPSTAVPTEILRINKNKFFLVYGLNCMIITVSDSLVISAGPEFGYAVNAPVYPRACLLDSNHFILCYKVNTPGDFGINIGNAVIGTITGTTIAYSANFQFSINNMPDLVYTLTCGMLTDKKFYVCYLDNAGGNRGLCRIGDIAFDFSTITYGAEYEFFPGAVLNFMNSDRLNEGNFILAYNDGAVLQSVVCNVNGNVITPRSPYAVTAAIASNVFVRSLDHINFAVVYTTGANSRFNIYEQLNSVINFNFHYTINVGLNNNPTMLFMNRYNVVVCFTDNAFANNGSAKVVQIH